MVANTGTRVTSSIWHHKQHCFRRYILSCHVNFIRFPQPLVSIAKKQDIFYPSDGSPGCKTFSAETRTITGKWGQFMLAGLQCHSADTLAKFETGKKRMKTITLSRHNGIIDGTGYLLRNASGEVMIHIWKWIIYRKRRLSETAQLGLPNGGDI